MIRTELSLDPDRSIVLLSAALGGITGIRSMAGPTLLARAFSSDGKLSPEGPLARMMAFRGAPALLTLLAGGEMIADKTPGVPARTSPGPLIGRAVIGTFTAAACAMSMRKPVWVPALVGGASAVVSAYAAFQLRRLATEGMGAKDGVIGLIEDAIVVAAGRAISSGIERG